MGIHARRSTQGTRRPLDKEQHMRLATNRLFGLLALGALFPPCETEDLGPADPTKDEIVTDEIIEEMGLSSLQHLCKLANACGRSLTDDDIMHAYHGALGIDYVYEDVCGHKTEFTVIYWPNQKSWQLVTVDPAGESAIEGRGLRSILVKFAGQGKADTNPHNGWTNDLIRRVLAA